MSWIDGIRARVGQVLRRRVVEERMDEEIRFHIEMETEKNLQEGLSPEEARRRAVLAFGGVERHREQMREGRQIPLVEDLWRDLRYAGRSLRKSPGFTVSAVLTLAVGVGANAAVFSMVSASLLRPLPFEEPQQIMVLHQTYSERNPQASPFRWWSYPQFEGLHSRLSTLHLGAYWASDANLSGRGGDPARVRMEMSSASYFPALRVQPALGRTFLPREDSIPGTHPVAVLGHGLWASRFGADPEIVGREVLLNGVPLTVIGVMPEGFRGITGQAELWIPFAMAPQVHSPDLLVDDQYFIGVVGRLRPGTPLEQARAEVSTIGARTADAVRAAGGGEQFGDGVWGAGIIPLEEARRDPATARAQLVLAAAALFVLLIAVVNLSGLLLARATTRARETALRGALGATRVRLVRQSLVEGGVLGLMGAAVGMMLALWSVEALIAFAPAHLGGARPYLSVAGLGSFAEPEVDWRVLGFAAGIALVAGSLAGLIPALRSTRGDLTRTLKAGARGSTAGLGSLRRPTALAAAAVLQVAAALVLLVSAALLLQGFQRLRSVDPGFNADGVVTFRIEPPRVDYGSEAAVPLHERILRNVEAVPGVRAATVGCPPLGGCASTDLHVAGQPISSEPPRVAWQYVGPDHFRVLGIPLLRGRTLTPADRAGRPKVALVDETLARRLWPGEDPIGKLVWFGEAVGFSSPDSPVEVVGVVGDVLYAPPGVESRPAVYTSYLQYATPWTAVMVRTEGDPRALAPALRRAVAEVDPNLAIHDVRTMHERAAEALAGERFAAVALGTFAGLGLLLATLGVYGVIAYSVTQRRREIGIRLALGSTPREVLRFVVGQGLTLTAVGLVIGLAAALVLARALPALIAGIGAAEPPVLAVVSSLLLLVTLAACYLPARSATRVNPVETLAAD